MKRMKLLTSLMALMIMAIPAIPAHAVDPAPADKSYTFDGVNYINVGSNTFGSNASEYRKDMLSNPIGKNGADTSYFKNHSYFDMMDWFTVKLLEGDYYTRDDRLQANVYATYGKSISANSKFRKLYETPYSQIANLSDSEAHPVNGQDGKPTSVYAVYNKFDVDMTGMEDGDDTWFYRDELKAAETSDEMEKTVAKVATRVLTWGENQDHKEANLSIDSQEPTKLTGPVYYSNLGIVGSDLEDYNKNSDLKDYKYHSIVVAYNNFSVTPIIPDGGDNSDNTYVVETAGDTAPSRKIVSSDLKNMSGEKVTTSQNISESQTTTLTSTISGSQSHTVSKTAKVGFKITPIKDLFDFSGEASKTWSDTVTSGWSEAKSTSQTSSESNTISVTLPAYTTVLMSQEKTNSSMKLRYKCPVALNFDIHIFYVYGTYDHKHNHTKLYFDRVAAFGGNGEGRADFASRLEEGTGSAEVADKEGVAWKKIKGWIGSGILNKLAYTIPFDVTDAAFTVNTELYENNVYDILPIYPIDSIKPVNPDSVLTAQKWKYEYTLMEGDSKYTTDIGLKALNKYGYDFYTFYQKNGYYTVLNESGEPDESVVKIEKDPTGTKFVAVGEGTAYVKYNINDETYRTADMVLNDTYINNSDDFTHAVIKIDVTKKHVHEFSKPIYGWSDDFKCTAYRKCSCGVEESETVDGVITEDTDPTCTQKGKTVYTATFDNEAFEKQTKTVEKAALGHDWGDWKPVDEKTHERVCAHDSNHTETADHRFDDGVLVQNSSTNGKQMIEYTCKDCGYSYREVSDTKWLAPTYTWSDDNKQCSAKRISKFGGEYTEEETSDAVVKVKSTKTCTRDGVTTYTATFDNDAFETQVKTVTDEAKGHQWNEGVVTKAPTTKRKGVITYTCSVCGKTKTVTTPVITYFSAKMMAKGKDAQVISWYKVKNADGYNVYMGACSNRESYNACKLVKSFKGNNHLKFTKKGLKRGACYKSYVEAYKLVGNKKIVIKRSFLLHSINGNYNGTYSNVKKIVTEESKITIKTGKKYNLSKTLELKLYKAKRKPLGESHAAKYRYVSSKPSVASVTASGKVKGLEKGKCKIYIYAVNGVRSTVTVTVK